MILVGWLLIWVGCSQPGAQVNDGRSKNGAAAAEPQEPDRAEQLRAFVHGNSSGDEPEENSDAPSSEADAPDPLAGLPPIGNAWVRLDENFEIWFDDKEKQVYVGGEICLTDGPLEMFACPRETKEHESVVSVNSSALLVHAALLRIGANPGAPVKFTPEYQPARGPIIKIDVMWMADGKVKTLPAQQMVRDVESGKPLASDWVFGGSEFWDDPDTKQRYYIGDAGELVCVSNFTTATMDLPIESSDSNASLLYEAFRENIPPRGTRVLLRLKPQLDASSPQNESPGRVDK